MKSSRVALLALAAALPVACTNSSTESAACHTFRTALFVKDRMSQRVSVFNLNEPITFDLEITNTSNAPATLTAGSSCTAVVFEVADSRQRRWGNADHIACIQMLQPRTYAALETVSESSTWDQTDSNGVAVPRGNYTVTASVGQYAPDPGGLLVDCRAELSKSANFRID